MVFPPGIIGVFIWSISSSESKSRRRIWAVRILWVVLIIAGLVVLVAYFGLPYDVTGGRRDNIGRSLPRVDMLERDENVESINGLLLSHDADYWYVLVDPPGNPPSDDTPVPDRTEVRPSVKDIKAVPVGEANNVRITK